MMENKQASFCIPERRMPQSRDASSCSKSPKWSAHCVSWGRGWSEELWTLPLWKGKSRERDSEEARDHGSNVPAVTGDGRDVGAGRRCQGDRQKDHSV